MPNASGIATAKVPNVTAAVPTATYRPRQIALGGNSFCAIGAFAAIVAHLVMRFALNLGWSSLVPLWLALVAGGVPNVVGLLRKAIRFQFGSDLLAGVSIVCATLMHEYLVATIVVLMLSGGRALEDYATRRASSLLSALAARLPTKGHQVVGDSLQDVALENIAPKDTLLVFPHEICPVDGEVVEGNGAMDEAYLTGEPFQIAKAPGSIVLSGAINGNSALKIRALRPSADSRYARIVRVMETAQQNRPRIRRIGDRLGAWYTPAALALGVAGWLLGGSAGRFLAVVVIATPCPLLLAIPIAIIGGISLAAERGIVIKNPAALEEIDLCTTFIFDKTGTLTYGRPQLTEVICKQGFNKTEVLRYAASLESYSKHPLAAALLAVAGEAQIPLRAAENVQEAPGEGLRGLVGGRTVHITGRKEALKHDRELSLDLPPSTEGLECLVFLDNRLAAICTFHDAPRSESKPFLQHLSVKHNVKRLMLVSGDRDEEVRRLAELLGIRDIHSGKSPEEKVALVKAEIATGKALFVGDGINDAPAMLTATVGVALGRNTDIIAEAADAVVMDSSLRRVDELMHIARRIRSIALQSAIGGMALSAIGMIAAALGLLPPIAGALAQEIIDVIAVANALRVTRPTRQLSDF